MKSLRWAVLVGLAFAGGPGASAQEKQSPPRLSAEARKGIEAVAGKLSWCGQNAWGDLDSGARPDALTNPMPMVLVPTYGGVNRLPDLGVPYALCPDLPPVYSNGLDRVVPTKNLTWLDLSLCDVTPEKLKRLSEFKALAVLQLQRGQASDGNFKALKGCGTLTHVVCYTATDLTVAGVKELAGLKSLVRLDLNGAKLTDADVKELAAFPKLTELDLSETQVTDAGVKELLARKQLTRLVLWGPRITDAVVAELKGQKNLVALGLSDTRLGAAGLKEVTRLKQLRSLRAGAVMTDDGLHELKQLKSLTALDVSRSRVTDGGMKHIGQMTALTALDLKMTPIGDAGLKELRGLKALAVLNLRFTRVTDAGLKELKEALPKCEIVR